MAAHTPNARSNDLKSTNPDSSTSSGSKSDSSNSSSDSPPSTPPSPEENDVEARDTQGGSAPPPYASHARHSRRNRYNGNSRRLGAIDEDSNVMSPDIPDRNPLRSFKMSATGKFLGFNLPYMNGHTNGVAKPPPGLYDEMTGPNGEKFSDLRENKKSKPGDRRSRRKFWCIIGFIILAIIIALAVGLGVGLTRKKSHRNESSDNPSPPSNTTQAFPAGTWGITTYLTNINTACTPNNAIWRCYPYQTYNESTSGSLTSLDWSIISDPDAASAQNHNTDIDWSYLITATNPTFSYPFTNVSLQPDSSSGDNSAFTFTYQYRKTVVPSVALTSDDAATRCYYDNVQLSVRLYTKRSKDAALTSAETGNSDTGNTKSWPYALEYIETVSEPPQCFRFVNGEDGDAVTIDGADATGACECGYRNYDV